MQYLVWAGAALTLTGLCLLVWSIVAVLRARREGLSDDELRARLQRVLPVNLGALALSALGLMLVVVGILLS